MPYILDKLRSQYTEFRGLSDEQLTDTLYRNSDQSQPFQEFARQLGVEINKPGMFTAARNALGSYPVGIGRALEDAGAENVGRAIRRYGEDVQLRNPIQTQGFEDIAKTPGLWLRETVGQAAGRLLPSVVPYVGPVGRALGAVGSTAAGTGISALASYGGVRADQESQGVSDPARAAAAAAAVGAIEQLGGVQSFLRPAAARALGGIATRGEIGEFGRSTLRTAGKAGLRVMAGEGAEEIAQNPIEQIGAFRDPTTAQSIEETLYGGLSGAVGALPFGGVAGVQRARQYNAARTFSDSNRDNTDAPLMSQLDALAIQREFIRNGRVEGVDPRSADQWYEAMAEAAVQNRAAPVAPSLEMQPDLLERARREQYPPNLPDLMQGPSAETEFARRGLNPPAVPQLGYSPGDGPIIMGGPAEQADPTRELPRLNPQWPVGAQGEMFRPNSGTMGGIPVLPTFVEQPQVEEQSPAPMQDTRTGDLFADRPTAMVPTMFNPASAPGGTAAESAYKMGAVAANLRSQISQLTGQTDAYTTRLSFDLAKRVGSLPQMQQFVDQESVALDKAITKLNKQVDNESNMLDPDEYAKKRAKLEDRRLALEAVKELVGRYQSAETQAYVEEATPRARPGVRVGQEQQSDLTEQQIRERSAVSAVREGRQAQASATAEVDARVRQSQIAATRDERMNILRTVMAEPTRRAPTARFREALRTAGFTNLDITPEEQQEIVRLSQRRDDVRAATKTPPGLAAARGKLTPRASLNATDPAAQVQQAEPDTPPAQAQPVQAQPVQAQPVQAQQAEPDTKADEEQLKEVGVDDAADIKYLDKNAREADTAKTQVQLNRALDRIFSMYMDTDSKAVRDHADKLLKDGFSANDLEMARRRYKDQLERVFRSEAVNPEPFVGKRMRSSDAMTSHSALEWIASNGSSPGFKQLALRIKSVIPDFPINYISTTDNLPDWLAEEMNLSNGVFVLTRSTGKLEVWVWEDRVNEGLLLHELLHAGTAQGIDADSQFKERLADIGRTIANAITGVGGERSGLDVEARRFFGTQMRRPHELLPFAFTSPMMQQALQRMDANGKWLDNKPVEARLPMPKQTLWGRLVDAVRGFLNLPKVYEKELARVLAHNARVAKQEMESQPITTLLGRLLDEALARNTAARAQSREDSAGAREVGNQRVSASEGQTDTPAFRRWFGDSKVVDENGKPIRMYHGTGADIESFVPGQADAIFLSPVPSFASGFAQMSAASRRRSGQEAGENIIPVYVRAVNPFDQRNREHVNRLIERLKEKHGDTINDDKLIKEGIGNVYAFRHYIVESARTGDPRSWIALESKAAQEAIRELGHDGFYVFENGTQNLAVYDSTQIKSAIGNNGEFNPNDRRINRQAADAYRRAQGREDSAGTREVGNQRVSASEGQTDRNIARSAARTEAAEVENATEVNRSRRNFLISTAALLASASGNANAATTLGQAKALSAVADARVSKDVENLLIGKGYGVTDLDGAKVLRRAMDMIATTGPRELRALAAEIGKLLPNDSIALVVERADMNAHGTVELGPLVRMRLFDGPKGISQGLRYSTLLHESLHAAVLARYRTLSVGLLRSNDAKIGMPAPRAAQALAQFRAVWNEFSEMAKPALRGMDTSRGLGLAIEESLSNPDEFFVRALTQPDLQAWMAEREYQGKTLLQRFMDWVKTNLLGMKSGTVPSWLDAALAASDDLLKAMGQDPADFKRFNAIQTIQSRNGRMNDLVTREASVAETDREAPRAFIEKARKTPLGYAIRSILGGWRTQPWRLGFLTLDQIKDRFSQFGRVSVAVDKWMQMGQRATELMRLPSHLHKEWAALTRRDRDTSRRLGRLLIDTTINEVWIDGEKSPELDERNKHLAAQFKNPEFKAKVDELRSQFMSMPQNARTLYTSTITELGNQFALKQEALLKRTIHAYRDGLRNVLSEDEMLQVAKAGRKEWEQLASDLKPGLTARDYLELQRFIAALASTYVPRSEVPGPYFPLQRRGDYVVVYKSADFEALERDLSNARGELDALLDADTPVDEELSEEQRKAITAAQKKVSEARSALDEAKARPADYVVEFYKWRPQADDRAAELQRQMGPGRARSMVRQQFEPRSDSVPAGFMSKLSAQLSREMPEGTRASIESAVRQLVIKSMPERSAFKAELRRMKVAGADPEDAMFSFVSAAHRNAWTISRLENITDLVESLNYARASDNNDERVVGNELMLRYSKSLEYNSGNALIDFASNASYLTHLGFSIGYWMQNATQPWMVSMPVLAGRHGFSRTNKALADATVEVVKAMRKTTTLRSVMDTLDMQMDMETFSAEEREMLQRLTDQGRIDITIRADLGVGQSTATNAASHIMQRAAEMSSYPAHMVEMVNRVATALAAFRLERGKGSEFDSSMAYADKIVVQTHVDYSMENAPRFMNPSALGGLGRLAFQFKRYQQAMVFLWGKTLIDAVRAGKLADNPDARALAYLTAVNFAMAGASGLPIAAPLGVVMWALSQIGEEDEERDLTEVLNAGIRAVLGETAGDVIRRGMPAAVGMDLSAKLGAGDILNPVRNLPSGRTGQEWAGAWALQLFGAAGGMVSNWADAIMMFPDNPVGAIQKTLPAGAKNMLAAVHREYEGVTDRRGNPILMADELGGADFAVKVLGLGESVDVTRMYDQRRAVGETERKRTDVRNRLMREHSRARMDGDRDAMAEVREEISAFNQRNPEYRIKGRDLISHHRRELERQREMKSGVRVNNRNADIAQDYGVR